MDLYAVLMVRLRPKQVVMKACIALSDRMIADKSWEALFVLVRDDEMLAALDTAARAQIQTTFAA